METTELNALLSAALPALGALVLIYVITVKLPSIAAFFDRILKRDNKPPDDGLYDIYGIKESSPDSEREDEHPEE